MNAALKQALSNYYLKGCPVTIGLSVAMTNNNNKSSSISSSNNSKNSRKCFHHSEGQDVQRGSPYQHLLNLD